MVKTRTRTRNIHVSFKHTYFHPAIHAGVELCALTNSTSLTHSAVCHTHYLVPAKLRSRGAQFFSATLTFFGGHTILLWSAIAHLYSAWIAFVSFDAVCTQTVTTRLIIDAMSTFNFAECTAVISSDTEAVTCANHICCVVNDNTKASSS